MRLHLIKLIFTCAILLQKSCNNCNRVDCYGASGFIRLKWIENGHNALFGPDATINRDSVRFYFPDIIDHDFYITYNDGTQTMDLYLVNGNKYVLEIKNTRTDTILGTMKLIEKGECCDSYQFTKVTMNSQVICQDGCDDIIEVQL